MGSAGTGDSTSRPFSSLKCTLPPGFSPSLRRIGFGMRIWPFSESWEIAMGYPPLGVYSNETESGRQLGDFPPETFSSPHRPEQPPVGHGPHSRGERLHLAPARDDEAKAPGVARDAAH